MKKFWMPGSPLEGHHVPPDWKVLDWRGKRRALVAAEIARDYAEAGRLLSRHANACRRYKNQRKGRGAS